MSVAAGEVNRGTLSRLQVQTLRGGEPNRYVLLAPNPAPFEWSRTKWNAGWWFVTIAYTLSALAAIIFVGLTAPANLPLAMLGVTLLLPKAGSAADYCTAQAQMYGERARIERGVAECARLLERTVRGVQIPGRVGHTPHRVLAARYQFWGNEVERLTNQMEALLRRPQHDLAARRANRMEAYTYYLAALQARVHAAYFDYLIINPNVQEDLDHFVRVVEMPLSERLIDATLSNALDNEAQNPLLISTDGRGDTLSVHAIDDMDNEQLRNAIFPIPGQAAP